ncbi:MAG: carbohydrate ABC transporter permease [Candidatus Scatosoma sp.]
MKRKKLTYARKEELAAFGFVSIKIIGFVVFTLGPMVFSLLYSFTNLNPLKHHDTFLNLLFNGTLSVNFENYKNLFTHYRYAPLFWKSFGTTFILMLSVPCAIALGTGIALCLKSVNKGSAVFRFLIYMPVVASAVALGYIWQYMFQPNGFINELLGKDVNWFNSPGLIKAAIIIKNSWGGMGRDMILILAGMLAINNDYYEAADLDGANSFAKFSKITFPMLTPTVFYLIVTGIIGSLQAYVDSQIFANGSEFAQTAVYFIWYQGIYQLRYGLAAAASTLLSAVILVFTVIQFKLQTKWVVDE